MARLALLRNFEDQFKVKVVKVTFATPMSALHRVSSFDGTDSWKGKDIVRKLL